MATDPAFGSWLRQQRSCHGWTLREVEKRTMELYHVRLSDTHLCQIETGKRPPPTISPRLLFALARLYELDMLEMLGHLGSSAGLQLSYRKNGTFLVPEAPRNQEEN